MRRILLFWLTFGLVACVPLATPTPLPSLVQDTPQPAPVTETAAPLATETASPVPPTGTSLPVSTPVEAAAFPDPTGYTWNPVAQGLIRPVDIQSPDDSSGRLFVVEQGGRILVIKDGSVLPTPFLDISKEITSAGNEQGLLGLAFHPHYASSGLVFVNYTDVNGNTIIVRFHVSNNPDIADPSSETELLYVQQPFANHNGGGLAFGPDGYLYLGLGDGGSQGDPYGNAQNNTVLLGKILRIDVDQGAYYGIPPTNPLPEGGGVRREIWRNGLRNPWRFSFDRATGDMFIGDVGQDLWEEIDYIPANDASGLINFGWNIYEGLHSYQGHTSGIPMIPPVAEYSHFGQDNGCAVSGGYVYRGQALPEWQGIYLFGDYCSGLVWGLIHPNGQWQATVLFKTGFNISSFGQDESGELYVANLQGAIYRLEQK